MKRFSEYSSLPVIDGSRGKIIGKCDYLALHPGAHVVAGVKLRPNGIFQKAQFIENSNIVVYGERSIVVELNKLLQKKCESSPIGLTVCDSNGYHIGSISDCFFNEQNGKILKFEVQHGLFDDIAYGRTCFTDYTVTELNNQPVYLTDYSRLKGVTL